MGLPQPFPLSVGFYLALWLFFSDSGCRTSSPSSCGTTRAAGCWTPTSWRWSAWCAWTSWCASGGPSKEVRWGHVGAHGGLGMTAVGCGMFCVVTWTCVSDVFFVRNGRWLAWCIWWFMIRCALFQLEVGFPMDSTLWSIQTVVFQTVHTSPYGSIRLWIDHGKHLPRPARLLRKSYLAEDQQLVHG